MPGFADSRGGGGGGHSGKLLVYRSTGCIWPNASKHFFLEWKIVFKNSFKYTVSKPEL